uniref:hypothetical protein n=1 Tax=Roseburia sp. TaxID=2049040 RepID=UPI003FEDC194
MSAIAGTGVSLTISFYKRNFYSDNRNAATSAKRTSYSSTELANADASAIRRAVRKLRSFTFDEDNKINIRNSVSAYVDTINNLMTSGKKTGDKQAERYLNSLSSLNSKYSDELDDIGITVNPDGTLTTRSTMFSSASISRFESLFSKDSDYMQKVDSYAKRLQKRTTLLQDTEIRQKNLKENASGSTSTTSATTEAAALVASALQLEQSKNGIGTSINLYL